MSHNSRSKRKQFPRLGRAWTVSLGLIALLTVNTVRYEWHLACSDTPVEAYPLVALETYHRLLVLAPHCDDEALGAGGLIHAALRQGMDVHVVIATAGDGYRRATMAESGRAVPRPADFIAMGELRQQESLDAMSKLGLDPSAVIFLTYPERGLSALWWDYWEDEQPYRSPYSGLAYNSYSRAFDPGVPYSGRALLRDLRRILATYHPDLIVAPHPLDEHGDHRALSAFVSLAVELEQADDATFRPQVLGYLVHYGLYPQPLGLRPETSVSPPRQIEPIGEWLRWELSTQDLTAKREAVKAYHSQQRVLAYYLNAFVRQNELFMKMDSSISLEVVEGESLPDTDSHRTIPHDAPVPRQSDPVDDSIVRRISGGADIEGLRLLRLGDHLLVGVDLRGRASRIYQYDLYVRGVAAESSVTWSRRYSQGGDDVWKQSHTVWYRLDLNAMEQPDWLVLAAETRRMMALDRTAWYVIRLEESPQIFVVGDEAP